MNIESISPEKLKDVLITRTAIKTLQPESTVEKVISHQFKAATEMMKVHHQVEVSGFGKYLISPVKVKKRLAKVELAIKHLEAGIASGLLNESRIANYNKKLDSSRIMAAYLKSRGNGYEN